MANKAAPKQTKKEMEEAKKRRWMIIIFAVLMIGIMIIVPLAVLINPDPLRNTGNGDMQKTNTFNSIADALKYLPHTASYVRFANLSASEAVTNWSMNNIGHNLPHVNMFGGMPQRDAVASFPYPTMGLTFVEDPQVVVLTDFGRGYDNASYPQATINGAQLRIIQDPYAFSIDSYPTVVGRKEYVSLIDNFMKNAATADTAYATYSDVLAQANQTPGTAAFAVVGTSRTLGFGDRYYAGITPINEQTCDYKIVIHLNQTLNETRQQDIALQWQAGTSLYGLEASAPQFKDNYVVLAARGDIKSCLDDMKSSNWYFIIE